MDPYSTSPENGNRRARSERHDDPGSQSGSDEGSTVHYPDSFRDVDYDDDPDALTSQTLNTDGTPKRPMNAFMIFARRRRPQVSAENQAMRTGEISKILSKEWAVMSPSEKQFYLDRAKQLKETFNSKYPDYVYRRRPNNSRKKSKRRLDPGMGGPIDHRSTPEASEDFGTAPGDYNHHHESDDRHYNGSSVLSRIHHDYIGGGQARASPYAYVASDPSYRHDSSHDPRVTFLTSPTERVPSEAPSIHPRLSHSEIYGYAPSSAQSQQAQMYSANSGDSHGRWEARSNSGPGRSGWLHERTLPTSTPRYGAGASAGWSGTVPAGSAAPAGGSTQSGNYVFSTLTSPFYPSQAPLQNYQATASSSSHSDSPARFDSPASQGQQNATSRDYDSPSYNPTPAVASGSPYTDNSVLYQHRLASVSRGLPPVQSLASYPHSPHPASAGASSSQGY
ncbi:hypothetical protein JOM56_009881 [Amanita muscaria]